MATQTEAARHPPTPAPAASISGPRISPALGHGQALRLGHGDEGHHRRGADSVTATSRTYREVHARRESPDLRRHQQIQRLVIARRSRSGGLRNERSASTRGGQPGAAGGHGFDRAPAWRWWASRRSGKATAARNRCRTGRRLCRVLEYFRHVASFHSAMLRVRIGCEIKDVRRVGRLPDRHRRGRGLPVLAGGRGFDTPGTTPRMGSRRNRAAEWAGLSKIYVRPCCTISSLGQLMC